MSTLAATNLKHESSASNNIVLTSGGDVGIGTSSPGVPLGVVANSGSNAIRLIGRSSDNISTLDFVSNNSASSYAYLQASSSYFAFGASATERMRIDSSGNLLVGTTSVISGGKVSVNSAETGYSTTISGGAGVGVGLDIQRTTANGDVCYFRSTTGLAGYITVTGASTCTYNQVSDYRLKENFGPIKNGLSTISQLSPLTYTWKADGTVGEGFIAHELQAVIPFAVTGEKDAVNVDGSIRPQGVDYSKIVVHLVAAIQELKAEIDLLKGKP